MTDEPVTLANSAQGKLRSLVERVERLNEDKAAVLGDIKEVFAEAKGEGFDVKILRRVIAMRARKAEALQEEQALIDLYMGAIQGDLFKGLEGGTLMIDPGRAEGDEAAALTARVADDGSGMVTVKERGKPARQMKPADAAKVIGEGIAKSLGR